MSIKIIGLTNEFHVNSSSSGGSGSTGASGSVNVDGAVSQPTVSTSKGAGYLVRFTTSAFSGYGDHASTDYKVFEQSDINLSTPIWQYVKNIQ